MENVPDNHTIAEMLRETSSLLSMQGANPYRAQAYYNAGELIDSLDTPLSDLVTRDGTTSLEELPGIGKSLAKSLERLVRTGRLRLLEKLRLDAQPEKVLATVGGIGPILAQRLHEELNITSLAELQKAVTSGRLSRVPGFGEKRLSMIRESLVGRLRRPDESDVTAPMPVVANPSVSQPSVSLLLDIDREYRNKARSGQLPRITPKQFNPTKEAWLPVLNTQRERQHYTILFSNTPRAHSLGVTRDWVIIYRERRDGGGQWTVITSQLGALMGRRVVRGREDECREYYQRRHEGEQPSAT